MYAGFLQGKQGPRIQQLERAKCSSVCCCSLLMRKIRGYLSGIGCPLLRIQAASAPCLTVSPFPEKLQCGCWRDSPWLSDLQHFFPSDSRGETSTCICPNILFLLFYISTGLSIEASHCNFPSHGSSLPGHTLSFQWHMCLSENSNCLMGENIKLQYIYVCSCSITREQVLSPNKLMFLFSVN